MTEYLVFIVVAAIVVSVSAKLGFPFKRKATLLDFFNSHDWVQGGWEDGPEGGLPMYGGARNVEGKLVPFDIPEALKFTLLAGLILVYGRKPKQFGRALMRLTYSIPHDFIKANYFSRTAKLNDIPLPAISTELLAYWNDEEGRTKEQVVELIRRAKV